METGDHAKEVAGKKTPTLQTCLIPIAAFGANDFSPGTYRTLVNLVTEEETYQRMFRTYATAKLSAMETEIVQAPLVAAREQLRQTALAAVEDEVRGDPDEWARVAGANLLALR